MQKSIVFSLAICLGLAGCQVFEKSETWNQAVKVQPGESKRDPDPSRAYAAKLHEVFAGLGIEHKVVVYQYRYTTRRREEAVGTHTAVVYRDNSNPRYPWWLKDDRSVEPFWLPNGHLGKQISFYLQRDATVIEEKEYPARGGSGKASVAAEHRAPASRIARPSQSPAAVARIAPAAARKPAPTKRIAQVPPATKPAAKKFPAGPTAPKEPTARTAITRIKPVASPSAPGQFSAPPPPTLKTETALPDPVASGGNAAWSPPGTLDEKEQAGLTAPVDPELETRFRAKHGTDYNRFSPVDRRKMRQLQQGVASAE